MRTRSSWAPSHSKIPATGRLRTRGCGPPKGVSVGRGETTETTSPATSAQRAASASST